MQAPKKQQGSIMIGAILLIVLLVVIMLSYYKYKQWESQQLSAKTLGNELSQVVNALENRMSFNEDFSDGNYVINDLISTTCGGNAPKAYLPCGFNLNKQLLKNPISIIVSESTHDGEAIRQATVTLGAVGLSFRGKFEPTPYLAGLVIGASKANQVFSGGKYLSASSSYVLNPKTSIVTVNIVANQNNSNIYLRVDGSNKMQNALQFNSSLASVKRRIEYVSDISNTQTLNIHAQTLNLNNDDNPVFLGNQSGVLGNANVTVNDLKLHSVNDATLTSLLAPVGQVISYAGINIPANYLECNGGYISRSTYAALFAKIGTIFGSSDGSNFRLPDLRGEFIRGFDHGRGIDKNRVLGSFQQQQYQDHDHMTNSTRNLHYSAGGGRPNDATGQWVSGGGGGRIFSTSMASEGAHPGNVGSETRPRNIALMYLIRYQ